MQNRSHPRRVAVNIHVDKIVQGRPHRKCSKCGRMRDLDDFGLRYMDRSDGTKECRAQAQCRECRDQR